MGRMGGQPIGPFRPVIRPPMIPGGGMIRPPTPSLGSSHSNGMIPMTRMNSHGSNFTPEQLQAMLAARQYMVSRGVSGSHDPSIPTPIGPNMGLASNSNISSLLGMGPNGQQRIGTQKQMPTQRNQLQADASTAAAFVALQNAQQAAKLNQVYFLTC